MIDLHCHLLPAIDDGAGDIESSLRMARMAQADGIAVVACTPHILPGVYNNTGPEIQAAVDRLQAAIDDAGIGLRLVVGADVHVAPDLVSGLRNGRVPSLNGSRYFLLEPPHHVPPPRFEDHVFDLMVAGYVPIITHPERLSWIEGHYKTIERIAQGGAWMQITGGSLTGRFGRRARYWAERMLDEDRVQILASDAHNAEGRPPILSEARDIVARRLNDEVATKLVVSLPQRVLDDERPPVIAVAQRTSAAREAVPSIWRRLLANVRRG